MTAVTPDISSDRPVQLRHAVFMATSDRSGVILRGERCVEIVAGGGVNPADAWQLLGRGHSPRECAAALRCQVGAVLELLAAFDAADLLARPLGTKHVDTGEAVRVLRASATMWKRHSILHPIFRMLDDDEPRRPLLAALLVEMCHYTRAAPTIAATAAAAATSPEGRAALLTFAAEEADHYRSLASGVACMLDVDVEEVLSSHPAPATIGLLSTIRVIGGDDAACFAALMCFTEVASGSAARTASDFVALANKNGAPRAALEPVAEHVLEDEALSHVDVGARILALELPAQVPTRRLDELARAVHDVKHAFDLLHDSLIATAGRTASYRLRTGIRWDRL